MIDRRRAVGWVVWIAILALTTLVLMGMRGSIELANVALTMLLVVLGGSVAGGRALGFMLAALSFVLINYYFQSPYDYFTVNKPIDWIVLVDFLATAFVTTELLARARQQAEAAEARASEVETLSQLGAESLQYATAEQALEAIASLVQRVMGADNCTIIPGEVAQNDRDNAKVGEGESESDAVAAMERRASARAVELGRPVLLNADNVLVPHASADIAHPAAVIILTRQLALPLRAKERIIGVLAVRGDTPLILDGPRRRLLAALGYYAALAIERMRLMAEAAQSAALREAQRAKDEIFAAVSHDLRTPLTTIKALAHDIAHGGDERAATIEQQADRLNRMVADLLDLSRLNAGELPVRAEVNAAEDLVGAAIQQVSAAFAGRELRTSIAWTEPVLVGRFDFVHALRILVNLLENAHKYSPREQPVDIELARTGASIAISVADRGPGIPLAERGRIFEPFYRPARSTPDAGSAGLGLSIALRLAMAQGGSLDYSDRVGGGSVFTLRLPAVSDATMDAIAG
jgi:two-component system, OmpR family, sensor histidine kinase KdpD